MSEAVDDIIAATPLEEEVDDVLVIDDVDVGDESELRRVVAQVESLVGVPGHGVRVSVLTTEQWKTVIKRMVPRTLRRGAELYFYMLRDPKDPQHLLVCPSAVRAINEGSKHIYQELVYTTLRCIPTTLSSNLRKGVDDIIAEKLSSRLDIDLYVRTYPRDSELVRSIIGVLSSDFGYKEIDWAVIMRRRPKRVFMALCKSSFAAHLHKYLENSEDLNQCGAQDLVNMLAAEPLPYSDPLIEASGQAMASYMLKGDALK